MEVTGKYFGKQNKKIWEVSNEKMRKIMRTSVATFNFVHIFASFQNFDMGPRVLDLKI